MDSFKKMFHFAIIKFLFDGKEIVLTTHQTCDYLNRRLKVICKCIQTEFYKFKFEYVESFPHYKPCQKNGKLFEGEENLTR